MNISAAPALAPAIHDYIEAAPKGYIPGTPETSVSTGITILVVDDDPWMRALLHIFLRETSCNLIEAQDGNQGIAALRRVPVDILVTDIVMPEKGGFATIETARAEFPNIKIVAISGVQNKAYCLRAAEMIGANVAIEKPISKKQLLQAVRRLM